MHKISIKTTGGHLLNYETFFLMILCERPKNKVTIFQLLVTDYLQYAERQKLNYYDFGYKIFEI